MRGAGLLIQTRTPVSRLVFTKGANVPKSTTPAPCQKCGGPRHYTGSRWRCSPCFNKWQTAWKATRTEEQRLAAQAQQTKTRRAWTQEQRDVQNARAQAWRDADPERHRAGARDWYERNAEYARSAKLAEYYSNPEKFYARNWVRKARIAKAVCDHGPNCVTAKFLKEVQGVPCNYCGEPATDADHFYPIARGGLHCVMNIVPACGSCNSRKSARDPHEWLESLTSN